MNTLRTSLTLVLFCVLLLPITASAHKMTVFAWASGNQIQGEIKFSGGHRAKHVHVEAQDADTHAVLMEGETNDNGEFTLALSDAVLKNKPDLLIVGNGGDGHRGEWPLKAKEYMAAVIPADTAAAPVSQEESAAAETETASSSSSSNTAQTATATVDEQLLRQVVSEEVNRAVTPIRRTLAEESERGPTLQDILGGIGWIFGMAGLAAWLTSRQKKQG
jgi:nickel transport protein